jgi:transporter family protein
MSWQLWALGSAFFAALTAILAKVGVRGVDSNLAMAIRALVIVAAAWALVFATNGAAEIKTLSSKTWAFLALSGLATGASWACYFRALQAGTVGQVAPLDKLSVPLAVVLAAVLLGEPLSAKVLVGSALITAGAWVIAR